MAISRCKAGEINSIEKGADTNGWLRGGEDPGLRCWQVVREELQHNSQRQVQKPSGVYFEFTDEGRGRTVLLHISRRLVEVWRAHCYVNERGNTRMISGLRDDSPSVSMTDEHDRTWTMSLTARAFRLCDKRARVCRRTLQR